MNIFSLLRRTLAVMKQDRFWFRGVGVFEVVVEGAAGDVWGGRAEGFSGGLVLDGGGVALGRVPDVLDRVVVGRVRRRMDRRDALQQLAGLVEAGQRFRVVGAGVVRDDRDLLCGVLHGQDRAHPRGLPLDQPFLHRPLSALNQFSAMMPTSTPREAYRVASAFIRTNT